MIETRTGEAPPRAAAPPDPSALILQLIGGFQVSQAVYVAAKLDVASRLVGRSATVTELAQDCGASEKHLRRLLRTLTSLGLFDMDDDVVSLLPPGERLARQHAQSLNAMAQMWMETHYLPFSELLHAVRTGEPAANHYLGKGFFDWAAEDPARIEQFSSAMRSVTGAMRNGVFDGYTPPEGAVIADIGAADGSLLIELLRHATDRRGIAFDLPAVHDDTVRSLVRHGWADRIDVVAGDFFDTVCRADVYLLSYVLHDWDDAACRRILESVAAAGGPGSRVLVVETIVPPGTEPHVSKMIDLTMLGIAPGQERTIEEYRALLDATGIRVDRVVPTPTAFSIIECTVEGGAA